MGPNALYNETFFAGGASGVQTLPANIISSNEEEEKDRDQAAASKTHAMSQQMKEQVSLRQDETLVGLFAI